MIIGHTDCGVCGMDLNRNRMTNFVEKYLDYKDGVI